jgi:hypothetical protein
MRALFGVYMATIPIDTIVKVNPGVLSAAGSAVDLNGLILTNSATVPIGAVQSFATAANVGAYFGLGSTEYAMATIYFNGYTNCTVTPSTLYFAQYPSAAVAGWMRGGSLSSMTLAQLQALSGTMTISVDGTAKTSSTINLSGATSFSNAATIIAAGFTSFGATCTWNATLSEFVFTSSTTGASSSISFATGTLSASLKLTSATGAVTSAGAIAGVPATFMATLILNNQNWALFTTTWAATLSEKSAFSAWVATTNNRYGYVGWDTDVNALTAGSTATWMYSVLAAAQAGTVPVYGDQTHASFILGYAASLDFNRLNGRATAAFKSQSGLVASVTDATSASGLTTNGYNFYGIYANAKQQWTFLMPGVTSNRDAAGNPIFLDTFLDAIWLNANLQLAAINLLTSYGAIPYNDVGYSQVASAYQDPINNAINFGAIRTGIALSASQIAQVTSIVGADVSSSISAKGYYLQIAPASAAVRVVRGSPSCTLLYTDGQSIQALTLASIEIQ